MDRAAVRHEASRIYKANWKALTWIGALALLLIAATVGLVYLVVAWKIPCYELVGALVSSLLAPITMFGYARVYLVTWRGGRPTLSDLFYPLRTWKRCSRAFLLGLILMLVTNADAYCNMVGRWCGVDVEASPLLGTLAFVVGIFTIWLFFRLALIDVLYFTHPRQGALETAKDSFRRMKGWVWRYIVMILSVSWKPILGAYGVILVATLISGFAGFGMGPGNQTQTTMMVMGVVDFLVLVFFAPYPVLATIGFADGLIHLHRGGEEDENLEQEPWMEPRQADSLPPASFRDDFFR